MASTCNAVVSFITAALGSFSNVLAATSSLGIGNRMPSRPFLASNQAGLARASWPGPTTSSWARTWAPAIWGREITVVLQQLNGSMGSYAFLGPETILRASELVCSLAPANSDLTRAQSTGKWYVYSYGEIFCFPPHEAPNTRWLASAPISSKVDSKVAFEIRTMRALPCEVNAALRTSVPGWGPPSLGVPPPAPQAKGCSFH